MLTRNDTGRGVDTARHTTLPRQGILLKTAPRQKDSVEVTDADLGATNDRHSAILRDSARFGIVCRHNSRFYLVGIL